MSEVRLLFDTQPEWLANVRAWAADDLRITHVWVFGSRATGRRRRKRKPDPVPDLDLGFLIDTLPGEEPGERLGYLICVKDGWLERLARTIPVKIDLQDADPATGAMVWPAVQNHGVLIYERADRAPTRRPGRG